MLGAFAVGKTSLVQQYVNSIFSEKYHTTIGVKIDQKMVELQGKKVNLILWDIHGEDEFQKVKSSYLTGASGYFLVVDGTRHYTIETARKLNEMAKETAGDKPFIVLINKYDLKDEWEITKEDIDEMQSFGWHVKLTSAKDDIGVDQSFLNLAKKMIE